MTARLGAQDRWRLGRLLRMLAWGAGLGVAFGAVIGLGFRDAPLLGMAFNAMGGGINAGIIASVILGSEIFLPRTRFGRALERTPFLLTLAVKAAVYGAVVALVLVARPGGRLAGAAASLVLDPDLAAALYAPRTPRAVMMLVISLLLLNGIFVLQVSRLVGERQLRDLAFGRYRHSRAEERFFLFVDIAGSTPLAERIGPAAVHRFLGEVFRRASDAIDDHHGEVYQYVGDEMVITWTVADGRDGARPVACFFAIEQALAQAAPEFEREFGVTPRLRAALHGGPVITGEVGGSRRAIVYHGDVMNTTSRIEQATRDLERPFLVSGDAVQRLADLDGVALDDLGLHNLRGRAAAIRLYAIQTAPTGAFRPERRIPSGRNPA